MPQILHCRPLCLYVLFLMCIVVCYILCLSKRHTSQRPARGSLLHEVSETDLGCEEGNKQMQEMFTWCEDLVVDRVLGGKLGTISLVPFTVIPLKKIVPSWFCFCNAGHCFCPIRTDQSQVANGLANESTGQLFSALIFWPLNYFLLMWSLFLTPLVLWFWKHHFLLVFLFPSWAFPTPVSPSVVKHWFFPKTILSPLFFTPVGDPIPFQDLS